jgi:DNA-binding transcriptional LysR family regulator
MLMTMALPTGLDIDLLRTFVIIAEEQSFTRAADRVGRTQSAVSLQMQRLESALGQTLLERSKGNTVVLTDLGLALLTRAEEMLKLNDDIVQSLRQKPAQTIVRFGIAEEIPNQFLSRIFQRFSQLAPSVEVQVTSDLSCALAAKLKLGELDLIIVEDGLAPRQWPAIELWRQRLLWVTSETHDQHLRDPLPLALSPSECQFRPPWLTECLWRGFAVRALDQCNRKYRHVSTSNSTAGQLAAAAAGLAVTATMSIADLPAGIRIVRPDEGLPMLPEVSILMVKVRDVSQPMTDMLADLIQELSSEK